MCACEHVCVCACVHMSVCVNEFIQPLLLNSCACAVWAVDVLERPFYILYRYWT